jgi:probable phosphoglycerate mutase
VPTAVAPLLLVRHGQTTWNAERRWQGWADAPLSELGERQALDAAAHLAGFGFTRACASDLQRARRTAELIVGADGLGLGVEVVLEPGLRERNVGAFSGHTMDEILERWPECFDPETKRLLQVPEGESDDDLFARTVPALIDLALRFPDDRLLVVSHGGVIRTIERHLDIDPGTSTPNLGGRWLTVTDDGALEPGDAFVPIQPELVTEPRSE